MDTENILNIEDFKNENDTTSTIGLKKNGIKVDKIIDEYKKRSSDKLKIEYIKSVIEVNNYINYTTKCFLADNILKVSYLKNNKIHADSCKEYLLYVFALIDTWTNIEVNSQNWITEYNKLDELGLIEVILSFIPEKEVISFKTILNMKKDDLIMNKYEIHGFISDQLTTAYPEMVKIIEPLIDKLNQKIETLDENKIEKMINKVARFVVK